MNHVVPCRITVGKQTWILTVAGRTAEPEGIALVIAVAVAKLLRSGDQPFGVRLVEEPGS